MTEIVALLQTIEPFLERTTLRQLAHAVYGMLVASGRITMLGLSRWTGKGGSYRTLQRLYHTILPWSAIQWCFFQKQFLKMEDEYLIAGDEVVDSKAGKETFGLDRFFSGIEQRVISGLSFFTLSLINVREEHSYPMRIDQILKSAEEKAASKAKAEEKKAKKSSEKRKRGRPKGSKNKDKQAVVLSAELLRIQASLKRLLETIGTVLFLKYVAMDGHFGNYPSAYMIRQIHLHLISKLRSDAALYPAFEGEHKGRGPKPKYGTKIDFHQMDAKYLKETSIEGNIRTQTYQGTFYNKEFDFALNVVILLKTNLDTNVQAHVILFSTDWELPYDKLIHYYRLRFQIEFNFRDCKQYWGLEDFMNVKETAVTNAANLSFFMVNFSHALVKPFRVLDPNFGILDLKSHFRGRHYATEIIKMLPQNNTFAKKYVLISSLKEWR